MLRGRTDACNHISQCCQLPYTENAPSRCPGALERKDLQRRIDGQLYVSSFDCIYGTGLQCQQAKDARLRCVIRTAGYLIERERWSVWPGILFEETKPTGSRVLKIRPCDTNGVGEYEVTVTSQTGPRPAQTGPRPAQTQ